MKFFLRIFIFSILFISILSPAFADEWTKDFQKIENYYSAGDYKRAFIENKKLFVKIEKKEGKETTSNGLAYFQQAKIYEALSKFEDYKNAMDLGFKILNLSEKPTTLSYAKAMNFAADAYIQYGNYALASECIHTAKKIIETTPTQDNELINEIKLNAVKVYYGQGYLLKAENLIKEVIQYRRSRIVTEELVVNPKTGLSKNKKLSSSERRSRNRDLVRVLVLYGNIAVAQNYKFRADSIFIRNNYIIGKAVRKKDVCNVDNLYAWGKLFESIGNNKKALAKYTLAFKYGGKTKELKYKNTSKQMINIHESVAKSYLTAGNPKKYNRKRKSLETRVKRYYGKNGLAYEKALMLQKSLLKEEVDKSISKLEYIIKQPNLIPLEHLERAKIVKMLSNNYLQKDNFEKAEELLTESGRIKELLMGKDAPESHLSHLDLANFHVYYSSKFKVAEELFDQSFPVITKEMSVQQKDYVNYMYGLSKLYELTDRYDQAFKLLDKAVEMEKKFYGVNTTQHAIALEKLASINISIGNYLEAEKKLVDCINIFKYGNNSDDPYYTNALETKSRLYIIQGNYEEAEKILKKSRKLSKRNAKESLKMGGTMEELATLYIHIGKYQETEEFLKESIKLKEAKLGPNHRNLINPYNQLGLLYLTTGNFTEAEKCAKKANKISLSIFGDSSVKYAESLDLLSRIYASIGDYEQAEAPAAKVVEIEIDHYGPHHIQLAKSLQELAIIKYHNNGKYDEVEKLLLEAANIIKSNLGDENPEYAEALKNLALFYFDSKKIDKSESLLEQPNTIWIKKFGADNVHSAEISFIKGNIAYERGNYEAAKNHYTTSKNSFARNFDNKHPNYVKSLSKEAQMYFILGDYKNTRKSIDESTAIYLEFVKKYFPSLSERQKGKFWNLIKTEFEFYNTVAITLRDKEPELAGNIYNFTLNIKALLLNSSIKVKERILNSKDSVLINKYEAWNSTKELLTSALSMTAEQRKSTEVDILNLEKEVETLEKELSEKSELFAKNYEKTDYSWEKIRDILTPNEYAVEIIRFRKFNKSFSDTIYYAAMVISQETKKYPDLVLLENGKELESRYLKYYRNCIKFNVEDEKSYDVLWKPIKALIKNNATVYLSCEGVYNQINLETIPTPDKGYIINDNDIILLSNTRDLLKRNSKKMGAEEKTVELFGNPNYYSMIQPAQESDSMATRSLVSKNRFNQLPGAEKEVMELNALLKSKGWKPEIYLENKATEERIKKLKSPKVFHIATHGFFMEDASANEDGMNEESNQNPLLRSGLLLKDGGLRVANNNVYEFNSDEGILTAYEAMNLNFDNTDLVVLSACETGLGEIKLGEGVYGLQRAFLVAGANSVVMSLFKVSDEVTKELMVTFYQKWIETGNKRKSFIEAKRAIKSKYDKPIYWGAFVMIGLD